MFLALLRDGWRWRGVVEDVGNGLLGRGGRGRAVVGGESWVVFLRVSAFVGDRGG